MESAIHQNLGNLDGSLLLIHAWLQPSLLAGGHLAKNFGVALRNQLAQETFVMHSRMELEVHIVPVLVYNWLYEEIRSIKVLSELIHGWRSLGCIMLIRLI